MSKINNCTIMHSEVQTPRFLEVLLFAVFVTLFMNGLDMTYHLLTGWVVHLNYAAVKLTMIFVASLLVTWLLGVGRKQNVVTSISGPLAFYVYYLFANPTLDRAIFSLDEQFWFFFLHVAFMLLAYGVVSSNKSWARGINAWWCSFTAGLLGIMFAWRFAGMSEEDAARAMTYHVALPLHAMILIAVCVSVIFGFFLTKELDATTKKNIRPGKVLSLLGLAILIGSVITLIGVGVLNGWIAGLLAAIVYAVVYNHNYFEELRDASNTPVCRVRGFCIAIPALLVGAFYEFVPRAVIKSISPTLLFDFTLGSKRIRQNDLILVATLLLLVGGIMLYTVVSSRWRCSSNV